jgi:hypothetical protein
MDDVCERCGAIAFFAPYAVPEECPFCAEEDAGCDTDTQPGEEGGQHDAG